MQALVLEAWQWRADAAVSVCVAPDGCRDVLLRQLPGEAPQWIAAPRTGRAYAVAANSGERFEGLRFEPGAQFNAEQFSAHMRQARSESLADVHDWVQHEVRCDPKVRDALQALAHTASISAGASALGLSQRSLTRLFAQAGLPPPQQWRRLTRLRRCARALLISATEPALRSSLVELAADFDFADQAHMNREFQSWLGTTPRGLLSEASTWQGLLAVGYGDG
jgi:AraC-like DNA-binding protein